MKHQPLNSLRWPIYIINSFDNTKVPNRQKVESYLVYIVSNVNNVYSFQLYQYLSHWTQLHNQKSRNRGKGAYLLFWKGKKDIIHNTSIWHNLIDVQQLHKGIFFALGFFCCKAKSIHQKSKVVQKQILRIFGPTLSL